jgi:hypothetical protein
MLANVGTLCATMSLMRKNTSLDKYTENNEGVLKPTLGKRIPVTNLTQEERERFKNEFLEETKLHASVDTVKR